jgi:beta-galactosidase
MLQPGGLTLRAPMLKNLMILVLLVLLCSQSSSAQTPYVDVPRDLSGLWRFSLDPTDAGVKQLWQSKQLPEYIRLPGILQSQSRGNEISIDTPWVLSLYDRFWYLREDYKQYAEKNVKVPFLSQPSRHYLGVAWYQRDIEIPTNWTNRRVVLSLERPHWETTVWLDNKQIGSNLSLVGPHNYELGSLTPGRHRVTIRVDNRMMMPYRLDAHSVSDSLAATWNGIVGKIQLQSTARVWIDDVQTYPNLTEMKMLIKVKIGNQTGVSGSGTVTAVWPDVGVVPVTWDEKGGYVEFEVPIREETPKWDEFNPKLHSLRIWLKGPGVDENVDLRIGLRDLKAIGKEFTLNGRSIIFRGTHSGGDFPRTGHPEMEVLYWKKLFELCRKWGLNHMRFHSFCPPEAAFVAADEVGFYLQPEPGMWNEISPGTPMEKMLYEETDRMIKLYGNHPSFLLLSASNEPKGRWKEALAKWVERYRKEDPRRLYANGTGHTEREIENITEGTDYLAIQRIGPKMLRRESAWFGSDYGASLTDINIPVIAHEVGQWAAYPDFNIIDKFKNTFMKPGNYEIFRDSLKARGMLEMNSKFAYASGKFQVASYKEEIEANLRTPGLGGFQLLDLHDYLGQGTALVGLLDAFWEPKGYVDENEFTQFCNTTVPLARLQQRVFTTADRFNVDVEVAHYGAAPLEGIKAVWRIEGTGIQGDFEPREIPIGKNTKLGNIQFDLSKLKAGAQYKLAVSVGPSHYFGPIDRRVLPVPGAKMGVTYFQNEWNFWVFRPFGGSETVVTPTAQARTQLVRAKDFISGGSCQPVTSSNVLVTNNWEEAEARLASGGKVLFSPRNGDLEWSNPPLDVVPVFWNRLMGPAWGRMLGLYIPLKPDEPRTAMLANFPTNQYFDWQWGQVMQNVRAINLDNFPTELDPVVWAIDDWNRNHKLGVLFEVAVGRGSLAVSAIDITKPTSSNVVLQQLRDSLLTYVSTDCFRPMISVEPEILRGLFFDTRIMKKLQAQANAGGTPANNVIDGDPNTFLLVGTQRDQIREQAEIVVSFPAAVAMDGLVFMPRQNHREHEGDIREFTIQVSDDGTLWSDIARGELKSTFEPQSIRFTRTYTARHLKLVSLSGFGTDKTTALAELAVIYAGPKLGDDGKPIEYQRNRSATPDIDEGPDRPKPSSTPTPRPRPTPRLR